MSPRLQVVDSRRKAHLLYRFQDGHIIVSGSGRNYLLDTGAPFSVGDETITIAGVPFPVEQCYMGVTGGLLTDIIRTPIDGMIGADILQHFNLGIYAAEGMVQFDQQRPTGNIVMPVQDFMGIPIVHVSIGGRVRRLYFDTGAQVSCLMAECLGNATPEGKHQSFYPLLGEFTTDAYSLDVEIGGSSCSLTFGKLPEDLRPVLEAGRVEGILGTELLRYFDLNLSLRDRMLCLEPHYSAPCLELAAI
jgi:hypothetical protein